MPRLHDRHFTLEEAREMLADVKALVAELPKLKEQLDKKGFDLSRGHYVGGRGPNGDRYQPPQLDRVAQIVKELQDRGIEVKGVEQGLIDFPHIRENGEEVYLCYLAGEPDILYWHPIPTGFAGRRPVSEL